MNKPKNITTITSTDLFYEQLADPTKLHPLKQTAKIVKNDDSEGEDSYVVDMNNNPDKTSPSIKFNPEKNNSEKHSEKHSEKNEEAEECMVVHCIKTFGRTATTRHLVHFESVHCGLDKEEKKKYSKCFRPKRSQFSVVRGIILFNLILHSASGAFTKVHKLEINL
jgi:hypothetical protein